MSLLSSTQGTPERVWSLVKTLEALNGSAPKRDLAGWLEPGYTTVTSSQRSDQDAADTRVAFAQSQGAAASLGLIEVQASEVRLTSELPAAYAEYADFVYDALLALPKDHPDAVLLAAFACVAVISDRDGPGWFSEASAKQIADAVDAGLERSETKERKFNDTKLAPWRRWMTFLGLMSPMPEGASPSIAHRLHKELLRENLALEAETPAAVLLETLRRRMPFLDGGALYAAAAARLEAPLPRTLGALISAALRDLHDEGRLELRLIGDAGDFVQLADDPQHKLVTFNQIIIREAARA